ncbi:hypothetical protein G7046_g6727 [Stylonectria norvegica]|nr:hypothetical protein G7046_g6727 [Stylonectria norvegica]
MYSPGAISTPAPVSGSASPNPSLSSTDNHGPMVSRDDEGSRRSGQGGWSGQPTNEQHTRCLCANTCKLVGNVARFMQDPFALPAAPAYAPRIGLQTPASAVAQRLVRPLHSSRAALIRRRLTLITTYQLAYSTIRIMAGFQQWIVEEPWLEPHCLLGEGPFYEKATKTVRFVDIKKKQLHTVSVDEGPSSLKTLQLDVCPTVTADIVGIDPQDKILLGIKYGTAVLDRKTGQYEVLARFNDENNERLRGNDGAADPHGRFWLGSMTDFGLGPFRAEGSLFRFGPGTREEFIKDVTIPNSIGWSPDNKTMYFTHSTERKVHAFDYDVGTGHVSNQRLFYQHDGPGEPDGFRVDVDGNVWHAVYGEGRVLKISPGGELIGEVKLPTRNITCVQFVETELVVTTAADEDGEVESLRFGGAVFRVDVGTRGLDLFEYKL